MLRHTACATSTDAVPLYLFEIKAEARKPIQPPVASDAYESTIQTEFNQTRQSHGVLD